MTAERARITVFDTTLRDGEQSPGCSMNQQEKLRLAHQLDRLGVDVIEAGFPIASDGDFESVKAIASAVRRPIIAGSGARLPARHRARVGSFASTRRGRGSTCFWRLPIFICSTSCGSRATSAWSRRGRRFASPSRFAMMWSSRPKMRLAPSRIFCAACSMRSSRRARPR